MTEQYSRDDLVHKIMHEVGRAATELRHETVARVLDARDSATIDLLVDESRALLLVSSVTERVLENMRRRV